MVSFFRPKKPELTEDQKRRLPPGQVLTEKWPVLHASHIPRFDPNKWDFRMTGLVEQPVRWTWQEFNQLPMTSVTCDIHCVTRWSKYDNVFEGVHIKEIMQHVKPLATATYVMEHADPDYTTNISLAELVDDDVILALKHNGQPLTAEHGGPLAAAAPPRSSSRTRRTLGSVRASGRTTCRTRCRRAEPLQAWSSSNRGRYSHPPTARVPVLERSLR